MQSCHLRKEEGSLPFYPPCPHYIALHYLLDVPVVLIGLVSKLSANLPLRTDIKTQASPVIVDFTAALKKHFKHIPLFWSVHLPHLHQLFYIKFCVWLISVTFWNKPGAGSFLFLPPSLLNAWFMLHVLYKLMWCNVDDDSLQFANFSPAFTCYLS